MEETQIFSLPRLNEPAPDFNAKTTHGIIKLSDLKGKWVVLFSHPADFTPVCTTEFIAFAKKNEEFKKLNTQVIGLSIDSIYSHLAWVKNIKDNFDIEIPFPIIDDLSMKVAKSYGMIHPGASDTSAVRAVFIIDAEGILRSMIYYPLTNGRSIDEILRIVEALQTSQKYGVATPENWKPGEKVIVPPPLTQEGQAKRKDEGYDYTDWYFSKKSL
ncbi:MAG: peroxiredoxin [Ignavibacteriales bacterium]|nr:peroxiredoxin [Ignavibacteriales bacterium]MBK7978643.1 peroxiredoxin [Ignavibacteriota bacterium]